MAKLALPAAVALAFQIALTCDGASQTTLSRSECGPIYDAVTTKLPNGNVPIVPDRFLTDWASALPCLLNTLENLKGVDSPTFTSENKNAFLSATGALRTILARLRDADKASNSTEQTTQFIGQYRKVDNIRLTSVLTYGTRSTDPDIRLNGLLILGNTIDNRVLCVPLDHLYDPRLANTPEGVRGRANLLAIVSVPAPWAFKENYDNLARLADYLASTVADGDDFKQTRAAIDTLRLRLKAQDKIESPAKPSRETRNSGDCSRYELKFATKQQVAYP